MSSSKNSDSEVETVTPHNTDDGNDLKMPKSRFIAIIVSAAVCMFMVALNSTIVAPAMTIIASDLDSVEKQTWIATAFMLGMNAYQPIAGKFSDIFGRKPIILVAISCFLLGAIVNAASPSFTGLIAGRSIQGFGSGGIMAMLFVILTDVTPRLLLPRMQSLISAIYGLGSVVGPLLGGAFVDYVTWRWDFWLSVILSGIALVSMIVFFKESAGITKTSIFSKMQRIDWLGTIFSIGSICCLLLALSWGPIYGWGEPHAYVSFIASGIAFIAFVISQGYISKEPIMPPSVVLNPGVMFPYLNFMCVGVCFMGTLYFAPITFQAVFGATSIESGVRLIPYMACLILGSIGSGIMLKKYPFPKLYAAMGAACNLLGFGLFHTLNEHDGWGKQACFLTFCGLSFGLSMQNSTLAVQMSAPKNYTAVATALCNFFMLIGGSISVAVYQVLLQTFLKAELTHVDMRTLGIASQYGAIRNYLHIRNLPLDVQGPIIHAYMNALRHVFLIPLVASGLGFIFALCFRNHRYGVDNSAPATKTDAEAIKADAERSHNLNEEK